MWCRRRRRLVKFPRVPVWRPRIGGLFAADDGRLWRRTTTTATMLRRRLRRPQHVRAEFDPFSGENLRTRALQAVVLVLLLLPLVETTTSDDEHVHQVVALVGDPVTLPCDARADTCGPSHSVKWYKNEQRVYLYSEIGNLDRAEGDVAAAGPRVAFVTNATPPYFRLRWSEATDEAQYRCEVTYLRVQDKCPTVTVFNLTVLDRPSAPEVHLNGAIVANGSKLAPLLNGDRLNLSCVSREGRPAPLITWWLDGHQVSPNELSSSSILFAAATAIVEPSSSSSSSSELSSKHVLHESILLEHDQKWTVTRTFELTVDRQHLDSRVECRVQHPAFQSPMTTAFTLDAQVQPLSLELLGPRQAVHAGNQVILVCTADGSRPAANLSWFNGTRADLRVSPRVDVTREDHGTFRTESRVTFNVTVDEHLTNLTCRATSSAAKRRNEDPLAQSIVLEVLYPPVVWTIPSGNITVKEHDSVSLTCDYRANPPNLTRIVWLKGTEPLVLGENHQTATTFVGGGGAGGGRPQLLVRNVSRADQGVYGCALENIAGLGTSVTTAQLGIQHPPEVIINIHPRLVNETAKAAVTLRCQIVRGNPHVLDRVKWYMDGKLLNETSQSELRLTSVTRHQHGDYSCKAHNMAGWGVVSQAKHLLVNYPPGLSRLTYSPSTVVKRGNVTLMCTVDDFGRPAATQYRWTRGKRLIKEVTSANWTIEPVTLGTEGNFTCVVFNEIGEGSPASTHIDVHAPPMFIDRLPHYKGVSVTVKVLSMTCRVECDPACHVEWLRNDVLIESSQYYSLLSVTLPPDPSTDDFQSVNSTLTWRLNAWPGGQLDRYRDNANFTCRSSRNKVGLGKSSTTYFRVEYSPENISILPAVLDVAEDEVAEDGVTRELRCKAYSYPDSNYVWLLGNQTVASGEVLQLTGPLSRERGGIYTCVVSNGRGNISATAWVNVLYKPKCHLAYQSTVKNKVRLVCDAQGNPLTLQFTWGFGNFSLSDDLYVNRKSHSVLTIPNSPAYVGTYSCVVNNSIGSSGTCLLDIAGWASDSQGWLDKWGDENLLVVSVVVAAISVFIIILCCTIVVVARRRKSRRKYGDNVELEERENADGQIQLPDGTGPGRPCGLSHSNLPAHKCNGSDAQSKLSDGANVPSLYKQICPGVLLPSYNSKKVDGTRDVFDAGSIGKSHQINEHETPNKKHPLRARSDGTTHYYPDLPIVLDVNHKVNTSAWGSQHEDIRTVEYITAPHV